MCKKGIFYLYVKRGLLPPRARNFFGPIPPPRKGRKRGEKE